jgi:protein HIRA/HIR1
MSYELPLWHDTYGQVRTEWTMAGFRGRRQDYLHLPPRHESPITFSIIRYAQFLANPLYYARILMEYLGTNEPPPAENWKILRRLIGHENDVQDLGWSYDSSIMVSVGLDSKIVVWSGHTFEKLKTLSVHQSHVKGITFDPANKYFATASDDRTIKLFRFTSPAPNATAYDSINNFVLEHTIVAPFTSSPLTTYFRRCSWSPDGNHIAAANAVNGPVSSVAIINRGGWDSDINLIGHEGPTEVCTFNPRLFSKSEISPETTDNSGYSTQALVTVIACAGQDKTLSIWNTSSSRPLIVCQDLAGKSISDLAWTPDGLVIFSTSLDGGIIAIQFERGELGYIAPWSENDKALQKFGVGRRGVGVVEDVAGLRLEEKSKAGELRGAEGRMGALMGDAGSNPPPALNGNGNGTSTPMAGVTSTAAAASATNGTAASSPAPAVDPNAAKLEAMKQRVTITKEGKKRIAPLLVSSSGTGLSSLPQSQLVAASSNNVQNDAPQSILDLSKPYDGLPRGGLAAMLLGNKRKAVAMDEDEEVQPLPKRPQLGSGPVQIMVNGVNGVEPAIPVPAATGVVPTPDFIRPAVINPVMSVSQVRLAVPKIRTHILRSLDRGTLPPSNSGTNGTNGVDESAKAAEDVIFEAQNPTTIPSQVRDPSRISATKRGVTLWQDYLPRAVILVTGNKNFWSAACEDGSIYTWTPAGRRILNALVLESQPVIIECREWWLLCITAAGMCYVWNIKTLSSPHPPVSLAPVLEIAMHSLGTHTTSAPGVTSAHLNSTGHIIVTLSNGDGYLYSPNMFVWQRLSEAWWAVGSQYWNSNDSSISSLQSTGVGPDSRRNGQVSASNVSAGIIPHLERHTTNEVLLKGRAYTLQRLVKTLLSKEGFESFESGVSIAHLENRVAAALQLGAKEEFRIYLFMYAKRLGAEGLKNKVEELLRSILGGILQEKAEGDVTEKGEGWMSEDDQICGWDRKELLKEVVLILGKLSYKIRTHSANNCLGKFRDLQRLTVQYARVLGMDDEENEA